MVKKEEGLKDFLKTKNFITEKLMHYKTELSKIEEKIESIVSEPLAKVRLLQDKDTGTITAMVEGFEVKQDMPKKVTWDQNKMKEIVIQIRKADDDPDKYVSVKYSITEKQFEAFPPAIKTVFMQAREIKSGKAKLTFKIKEV